MVNQANVPAEKRLKGLRVLVTAGAGGAGLTISRYFADAGARVFACDVDTSAISKLAKDRKDIEAIEADIGNEEAVDNLFKQIESQIGCLDVLINNAGIAGPTAAVEDITLDEWNTTLGVNLTGQFLCIRRAVPLFKAQGAGSIINVSSMSARVGLPLRAGAVVSKAGVLSLTQTLARELGPFGIRVNAILPGGIEGNRLERIIREKSSAMGIKEADYKAEMVRYTSMRTLVKPSDIADMALFLASPNAARVSGQMIAVDGNLEWEE